MSWLFRFGAMCAVLGAVACTGNPKPLPPNNVDDANMPPQDAGMQADANVGFDGNVQMPDASTDAGNEDGGRDGAMDGGGDATTDGGEDGAVDGGDDGSVVVDAAADTGLFVPDSGLKQKDGGDIIIPPPPND